MRKPLHETRQRLEALIQDRGLDRAEELNPATLAEKTALPQATVETLLSGGEPPEDDVNERVAARIQVLANRRIETSHDRAVLVADLAHHAEVSLPWARKFIAGEKVPNVAALHRLANYFGVDERFFTAPAEEALDMVLAARLHDLEEPITDPYKAIMAEYGVVSTDLRRHQSSITPEQFRFVLDGIMRGFQQGGGDN